MKGELRVVAKTGGIKVGSSDTWINPTPEAKKDVLEKIDEMKKLVGEIVEVTMNEDKYYSAVKPTGEKPVKSNYTKEDNKTKSYALSYSKDLAVAGKIEVNQIIDNAQKFNEWLKE